MAPLSFYESNSSPLIDDDTLKTACECSTDSRLDGDSMSFAIRKVAPAKSCMKKTSQKRSRKHVTFSEYSQQYTHIHRNDYSEEERRACFLTPAQITAIVGDINRTLRQMRMGRLPNNDTSYFRGLEIELVGPKTECEERRELAMYAIQDYEAEHKTPYLDEAWVNSIYKNITAKSTELGKKAACYDQVQAEQVYKEEIAGMAKRLSMS